MTHFILLFCIHIRAKVDLIYKWDLQLFYFMDWLFFCIEVYNICIFFAINSMHGKKKIKKDKRVSQYSSKPQLVEANHQSNILCFLNFQNTFGLELYESAFCE